MSRLRHGSLGAVALALSLALAGCRQAGNQPLAQTAVAPASSPNPLAFAGAYRIEQTQQAERTQNQVNIILNSGGSAVVAVVKLAEDTLTTADSKGAWQVIAPDRVKVVLAETNGQALETPVVFELAFGDGFITHIIAGGQSEQVTGYRFTLDSGNRHPAIIKLHEKLARIPWLNFKAPGPSDDVYGEATRKAVVVFQESQGMPATGIVDAPTWAALDNPIQPGGALTSTSTPPPTYAAPPGIHTPLPTAGDTPEPAFSGTPTACAPVVTANDAALLRSGPGTDYDEIAVMPRGSPLDITGRDAGGAWFQVTFDGQQGWVFGELVAAQCAGDDLPVIDVPGPHHTPTDTPTRNRTHAGQLRRANPDFSRLQGACSPHHFHAPFSCFTR